MNERDVPHADKSSYTVEVTDRGTVRREAHFRSYGAAEIWVRAQAERSPAFVTYQIRRGTRQKPGPKVGPPFHGLAKAHGTSRDFDKRALMRQIERERQADTRRKLSELWGGVRSAVAKRRAHHDEVTSYCRRERAGARERIAMLRANVQREAVAERLAARARCAEAREAPKREIAELRRKLTEERRFIAEMKRIEHGRRRRVTPMASARVRESESDDEVRANIPPELLTLFERVKRSIKAGPRKSRTEAFLEYVESHPGEEYGAIEDKTDALIAELERRQRMG